MADPKIKSETPPDYTSLFSDLSQNFSGKPKEQNPEPNACVVPPIGSPDWLKLKYDTTSTAQSYAARLAADKPGKTEEAELNYAGHPLMATVNPADVQKAFEVIKSLADNPEIMTLLKSSGQGYEVQLLGLARMADQFPTTFNPPSSDGFFISLYRLQRFAAQPPSNAGDVARAMDRVKSVLDGIVEGSKAGTAVISVPIPVASTLTASERAGLVITKLELILGQYEPFKGYNSLFPRAEACLNALKEGKDIQALVGGMTELEFKALVDFTSSFDEAEVFGFLTKVEETITPPVAAPPAPPASEAAATGKAAPTSAPETPAAPPTPETPAASPAPEAPAPASPPPAVSGASAAEAAAAETAAIKLPAWSRIPILGRLFRAIHAWHYGKQGSIFHPDHFQARAVQALLAGAGKPPPALPPAEALAAGAAEMVQPGVDAAKKAERLGKVTEVLEAAVKDLSLNAPANPSSVKTPASAIAEGEHNVILARDYLAKLLAVLEAEPAVADQLGDGLAAMTDADFQKLLETGNIGMRDSIIKLEEMAYGSKSFMVNAKGSVLLWVGIKDVGNNLQQLHQDERFLTAVRSAGKSKEWNEIISIMERVEKTEFRGFYASKKFAGLCNFFGELGKKLAAGESVNSTDLAQNISGIKDSLETIASRYQIPTSVALTLTAGEHISPKELRVVLEVLEKDPKFKAALSLENGGKWESVLKVLRGLAANKVFSKRNSGFVEICNLLEKISKGEPITDEVRQALNAGVEHLHSQVEGAYQTAIGDAETVAVGQRRNPPPPPQPAARPAPAAEPTATATGPSPVVDEVMARINYFENGGALSENGAELRALTALRRANVRIGDLTIDQFIDRAIQTGTPAKETLNQIFKDPTVQAVKAAAIGETERMLAVIPTVAQEAPLPTAPSESAAAPQPVEAPAPEAPAPEAPAPEAPAPEAPAPEAPAPEAPAPEAPAPEAPAPEAPAEAPEASAPTARGSSNKRAPEKLAKALAKALNDSSKEPGRLAKALDALKPKLPTETPELLGIAGIKKDGIELISKLVSSGKLNPNIASRIIEEAVNSGKPAEEILARLQLSADETTKLARLINLIRGGAIHISELGPIAKAINFVRPAFPVIQAAGPYLAVGGGAFALATGTQTVTDWNEERKAPHITKTTFAAQTLSAGASIGSGLGFAAWGLGAVTVYIGAKLSSLGLVLAGAAAAVAGLKTIAVTGGIAGLAYPIYDAWSENDRAAGMNDEIVRGILKDKADFNVLTEIAKKSDDDTFVKLFEDHLKKHPEDYLDVNNPKVVAFWRNPALQPFVKEAIDKLLWGYIGTDDISIAFTLAQLSGNEENIKTVIHAYRTQSRVSQWRERGAYQEWQKVTHLPSFEAMDQFVREREEAQAIATANEKVGFGKSDVENKKVQQAVYNFNYAIKTVQKVESERAFAVKAEAHLNLGLMYYELAGDKIGSTEWRKNILQAELEIAAAVKEFEKIKTDAGKADISLSYAYALSYRAQIKIDRFRDTPFALNSVRDKALISNLNLAIQDYKKSAETYKTALKDPIYSTSLENIQSLIDDVSQKQALLEGWVKTPATAFDQMTAYYGGTQNNTDSTEGATTVAPAEATTSSPDLAPAKPAADLSPVAATPTPAPAAPVEAPKVDDTQSKISQATQDIQAAKNLRSGKNADGATAQNDKEKAKNRAQAKTVCERILANLKDLSSPEAHYLKGRALAYLGTLNYENRKYKEAIKQFGNAETELRHGKFGGEDPTFELGFVYLGLAHVAVAQKQDRVAIEQYKKSAEQFELAVKDKRYESQKKGAAGNLAEAYYEIALPLLKAKKHDEAREKLTSALSYAKDSEEAGLIESVQTAYDALPKKAPAVTPTPAPAAPVEAPKADPTKTAIDQATQDIQAAKNLRSGKTAQGTPAKSADEKATNKAQAKTVCEGILTSLKDISSPEAHYLKGRALAYLGTLNYENRKYQEAIKQFDDAETELKQGKFGGEDPTFELGFVYLGLARVAVAKNQDGVAIGQYKKSAKQFELAVKDKRYAAQKEGAAGNLAEAYCEIGAALLKAKKYSEAKVKYEAALKYAQLSGEEDLKKAAEKGLKDSKRE